MESIDFNQQIARLLEIEILLTQKKDRTFNISDVNNVYQALDNSNKKSSK